MVRAGNSSHNAMLSDEYMIDQMVPPYYGRRLRVLVPWSLGLSAVPVCENWLVGKAK